METISYAYHIKVDGKIIFLYSELEVSYEGYSKPRVGTLVHIGPSGIYMNFPELKNNQFINFKKLIDLKVLKEAEG